jgi:hypothetical protein
MAPLYVSVVDPVHRAIDRTKRILFKPFNLGKWFVMGFCAFLAALGEGGCGNSFDFARGGGGGGTAVRDTLEWIGENVALLIALGLPVLLLMLAFAAVLAWLSARGKFMLLDNILLNRGAIAAPWKAWRAPADRYFAFSLGLNVAAFLVLIVIAAIAALIAWPDIQRDRFGDAALVAVLVGVPMALIAYLGLLLIRVLLDDFVLPAMYLRGVGVRGAWQIVQEEVLLGRWGTIMLFYLMRVLLGLASGILAFLAICATCCIGALPYLSSVVLLPLTVFNRCYGLHFLEQFGPGWRFFVDLEWPPRCAGCGYDLRANAGGYCPECGRPLSPEQLALLRQPPPEAGAEA